MNPKVSVIIPMYNVMGKLQKCVQSLCSQTLSNIELVFVDDCSPDNCQEELRQLLDLYQNNTIRVLIEKHEKNRGVAAARNTGVAKATGEFIYYVDADDYIEPNTLELLYLKAVQDNLDIVGCEWFLTYCKSERHVGMPDTKTGLEMFHLMTNGVMRWNLWLFLVKRSLYVENGIHFVSGMNMGEDMMVMMKLSLCAKRTGVIHIPLYHYVQTNSNSLTKNYQSYKRQITSNIESLEKFMNDNGFCDYHQQIDKLKLAVKLPLLISSKKEDFEEWTNWFCDSNYLATQKYGISFRTYLLQMAAIRRQFWYIKLYYFFIIKFIYGIIYK